jgi:predicted GTPase
MANTIEAFDFVTDISGARVIGVRERLCPGCKSDGEVDENIRLLKEDLDAVATQMKRSIREQAKKSLDLEISDA